MGEDDDMERKAVYLGRTLECGEIGLGVRPDRRHVRSLLREMVMENCRSISTPLSATAEKEGDRSERPEMSAEFATKHRAAAAWVVYLDQDRMDLGVAAVELAKTMAIPKEITTSASNVSHDICMVTLTTFQWYPVQDETKNSCFNHGC